MTPNCLTVHTKPVKISVPFIFFQRHRLPVPFLYVAAQKRSPIGLMPWSCNTIYTVIVTIIICYSYDYSDYLLSTCHMLSTLHVLFPEDCQLREDKATIAIDLPLYPHCPAQCLAHGGPSVNVSWCLDESNSHNNSIRWVWLLSPFYR